MATFLGKCYFDCFLIIENFILIVWVIILTWFIYMQLQKLHLLLADDCCIGTHNSLPNLVAVHVVRLEEIIVNDLARCVINLLIDD